MTDKRIFTFKEIEFIKNYLTENYNPTKYQIKECLFFDFSENGKPRENVALIKEYRTSGNEKDRRVLFAFEERDDLKYNLVFQSKIKQSSFRFLHTPTKNNKPFDVSIKNILAENKVKKQKKSANSASFKKISKNRLSDIVESYIKNAGLVPWYQDIPCSGAVQINGVCYLSFQNLISHIISENGGKNFYPVNIAGTENELFLKNEKQQAKEIKKVRSILTQKGFKYSNHNPFTDSGFILYKGVGGTGGKGQSSLDRNIKRSKIVYKYLQQYISGSVVKIPDYNEALLKQNPYKPVKSNSGIFITTKDMHRFFDHYYSEKEISFALNFYGFEKIRFYDSYQKKRMRKFKISTDKLLQIYSKLEQRFNGTWVLVIGFEEDYVVNENADFFPLKNLNEFRVPYPEYVNEDGKMYVFLYDSKNKEYKKTDPVEKMIESFTKNSKKNIDFLRFNKVA